MIKFAKEYICLMRKQCFNFRATIDAVLSMLPSQKPMRALIRSNHFEPYAQLDIVPFYEK